MRDLYLTTADLEDLGDFLAGAPRAHDPSLRLVEHDTDIRRVDHGPALLHVIDRDDVVLDADLVPQLLGALGEVVPLSAQDDVARVVEQLRAELSLPFSVPRSPARHGFIGPAHPLFGLRRPAIAVRRAHAAGL